MPSKFGFESEVERRQRLRRESEESVPPPARYLEPQEIHSDTIKRIDPAIREVLDDFRVTYNLPGRVYFHDTRGQSSFGWPVRWEIVESRSRQVNFAFREGWWSSVHDEWIGVYLKMDVEHDRALILHVYAYRAMQVKNNNPHFWRSENIDSLLRVLERCTGLPAHFEGFR